jgi:hypothetical protein
MGLLFATSNQTSHEGIGNNRRILVRVSVVSVVFLDASFVFFFFQECFVVLPGNDELKEAQIVIEKWTVPYRSG